MEKPVRQRIISMITRASDPPVHPSDLRWTRETRTSWVTCQDERTKSKVAIGWNSHSFRSSWSDRSGKEFKSNLSIEGRCVHSPEKQKSRSGEPGGGIRGRSVRCIIAGNSKRRSFDCRSYAALFSACQSSGNGENIIVFNTHSMNHLCYVNHACIYCFLHLSTTNQQHPSSLLRS